MITYRGDVSSVLPMNALKTQHIDISIRETKSVREDSRGGMENGRKTTTFESRRS